MTMTTASLFARAHDGVVDETDPAVRPRRRTFTAEYKSQILAEYDSYPAGAEERGALLRREGLYTSHIAEWRRVRDAGVRHALTPKSKSRRDRAGAPAPAQRTTRGRARPDEDGARHRGKSTRALGAALRERGLRPQAEAVIAEHFADLEASTSTARACELLGASRATHYRRRRPPVLGPRPPRPSPPNALGQAEREHIVSVLRSQEYCDLAPAQIWARLLDDATYLCSISTMYRILSSVGENRERRRQRTHPAKKKPELIARKPLQVWTWDISKLRGPERGIYYQLYVIIDIFSRYVVGWMVSAAETGELAEAFIAETLAQHKVDRDQLTRSMPTGARR